MLISLDLSVERQVTVSKSVETMKPHPNPLLTAKVAPPIDPAILLKPRLNFCQ